jgi:hypothetical protein
MKINCYDCEFWDTWKHVSEEKGILLYLCPAFPEGIPEDIRTWEKPHVEVRKDQRGEFVFTEKENL